jgi:transposase
MQMLSNKPRGVPRVDDRRILNRIVWILHSGAPWRGLPKSFGPYSTNKFWACPQAASISLNDFIAHHEAYRFAVNYYFYERYCLRQVDLAQCNGC